MPTSPSPSRRSDYRRTPAAACALVTFTALATAACASSGWAYVKSSRVKTYFKVPQAWKLYNEQQIFAATPDSEISPQQLARRRASQWVVAFDGDPNPTISHILDEHARYPMGFAKVRLITDSERDTFSLASLRNEVVPLDEVSKLGEGTVEQLKLQDIVRHDGLHGNRQVQNVKVDSGFFTMDQTALVDPGTRLLYLLLVGCEARCYLDNQTTIDEIVRSWTVQAP